MAVRIVHRKSLRSTTGPTKPWVCSHQAVIYSSTNSASLKHHACPKIVLAGLFLSPSPTGFCWRPLITVTDMPSTSICAHNVLSKRHFGCSDSRFLPLVIHLSPLPPHTHTPHLSWLLFLFSISLSLLLFCCWSFTALTFWLISHFIIKGYKITARFSVCVFVPVLLSLPPLLSPISQPHQYLLWYLLLSSSLLTAAVIQE